MKQLDMFEELIPKIYESPDKGKTVYARDFGSDPSTREVVKTSVQQQWNITYKNSTLTEVDMNELMMAASRGRGDWEKYIQPGTIGVCRAAPDGVHIIVDPPKVSGA